VRRGVRPACCSFLDDRVESHRRRSKSFCRDADARQEHPGIYPRQQLHIGSVQSDAWPSNPVVVTDGTAIPPAQQGRGGHVACGVAGRVGRRRGKACWRRGVPIGTNPSHSAAFPTRSLRCRSSRFDKNLKQLSSSPMPNGTSDPRYTKRKDAERDGVDLSGIDVQFTIDLSQSLLYKRLTPVVAVSSGRARALEARICSRRSTAPAANPTPLSPSVGSRGTGARSGQGARASDLFRCW
jgi:hypothetical protein